MARLGRGSRRVERRNDGESDERSRRQEMIETRSQRGAGDWAGRERKGLLSSGFPVSMKCDDVVLLGELAQALLHTVLLCGGLLFREARRTARCCC